MIYIYSCARHAHFEHDVPYIGVLIYDGNKLNIYQTSIEPTEHISTFIENISKFDRPSIEHLSKLYRPYT